ncbi:MAG: SDR family oxidoreductase [Gemmatimonadota bacterium]|nr:SDR family oxidoreductase [Gemmatimonadota bacterium]
MKGIALPGIEGRRVLVTGGSRGIGRAVVRLLARAGASVGVAYFTDGEAADSIVSEAEGIAPDSRFWSEAADLSEEADCDRLFSRVDREFGGLDGFVGNAGIWNAEPSPIEALSAQEWDRMLAVNLTSIYLTTRAAVARMGPGGRIVLLSSTAGQRGEAEHSHYAASKGAIISFTKSIATELGPRDITVNAVAPGWVDTEMSASVLRTAERSRIEADVPLRRIGTADDLAGPTVFLLSDLARHITGEVLNVNGGSVLCG